MQGGDKGGKGVGGGVVAKRLQGVQVDAMRLSTSSASAEGPESAHLHVKNLPKNVKCT